MSHKIVPRGKNKKKFIVINLLPSSSPTRILLSESMASFLLRIRLSFETPVSQSWQFALMNSIKDSSLSGGTFYISKSYYKPKMTPLI